MNSEEYRSWKSEIVSHANNLAYSASNSIWGRTLSGNCLPVSQLVINKVRETFPTAGVVIGNVLRVEGQCLSTSAIHAIVNFFYTTDLSYKPNFHAWIKIDNNRFLDIVGPSWFCSGEPYFDETTHLQQNFFHHEVLSKACDVNKFYERLKIGQEANWQSA